MPSFCGFGKLTCSVKVVDAKGIREVTEVDRPETVDLMQE
jgi:hypothetical protein